MKKILLAFLLPLILLAGCQKEQELPKEPVPPVEIETPTEPAPPVEPEIPVDPNAPREIKLTDEIIIDFATYYSAENEPSSRSFAKELELLPEFSELDTINHNEFIYYLNNVSYFDEWESTDNGTYYSAKLLEDTALKLFGKMPIDFRHKSTDIFIYKAGKYKTHGHDNHGLIYYRIKRLTEKDGVYTATFDGFQITAGDNIYNPAESTYNMLNLANYIETNHLDKTEYAQVLINNLFIEKDYAAILKANNSGNGDGTYETIYETTITFKTTDDKDFPIQYLSKKSTPIKPQR